VILAERRVSWIYKVQYVSEKIKESVISNITDLGLLSPIIDPVSWQKKGILGTESQAFDITMYAARRNWVKSYNDGLFQHVNGNNTHRDTI
jgi:hypothetical protein